MMLSLVLLWCRDDLNQHFALIGEEAVTLAH